MLSMWEELDCSIFLASQDFINNGESSSTLVSLGLKARLVTPFNISDLINDDEITEADIGPPKVKLSDSAFLNRSPSHNENLEPLPQSPYLKSRRYTSLEARERLLAAGEPDSVGFRGVVIDGPSPYFRFPPAGPYYPPPGPFESSLKSLLSTQEHVGEEERKVYVPPSTTRVGRSYKPALEPDLNPEPDRTSICRKRQRSMSPEQFPLMRKSRHISTRDEARSNFETGNFIGEGSYTSSLGTFQRETVIGKNDHTLSADYQAHRLSHRGLRDMDISSILTQDFDHYLTSGVSQQVFWFNNSQDLSSSPPYQEYFKYTLETPLDPLRNTLKDNLQSTSPKYCISLYQPYQDNNYLNQPPCTIPSGAVQKYSTGIAPAKLDILHRRRQNRVQKSHRDPQPISRAPQDCSRSAPLSSCNRARTSRWSSFVPTTNLQAGHRWSYPRCLSSFGKHSICTVAPPSRIRIPRSSVSQDIQK